MRRPKGEALEPRRRRQSRQELWRQPDAQARRRHGGRWQAAPGHCCRRFDPGHVRRASRTSSFPSDRAAIEWLHGTGVAQLAERLRSRFTHGPAFVFEASIKPFDRARLAERAKRPLRLHGERAGPSDIQVPDQPLSVPSDVSCSMSAVRTTAKVTSPSDRSQQKDRLDLPQIVATSRTG